ncbi:flavanone 3-dioxygenase 3-like protein [Tanacetum coccineum]
MKQGEISEGQFTSAMTLTREGSENIPERYILPPLQRPNRTLIEHPLTSLPVIDLSLLNDPLRRSQATNEIQAACNKLGFFQVVNHGVPISVMQDALDVAREFFHLPSDEKMQFASANVHEPVREKMGTYAKAVHILQKQLMGIVLENLGLDANYLHEDIEAGSQVMAVNCYPPCPEPDLALGMPPHSDYGTITILNQNQQGLEIMDHDNIWHPVPFIQGALIVQLGDQVELMSNGRHKSTIHRATVNMKSKRLSIASIHSMPIDKKVGPTPQLVDEQYPAAYKEGSFREFLDYISANCLSETRYIDTLKIP